MSIQLNQHNGTLLYACKWFDWNQRNVKGEILILIK
jgi:hypothetical protein